MLQKSPPPRISNEDLVSHVLHGTISKTGEGFFRSLVFNVAKALKTDGAWVTEYLPEHRRLRALAFWFNCRYEDDFEYCIDNTPCQAVIDEGCTAHIPSNIIELFPGDNLLPKVNAVSYIGVPLLGASGEVIGHLGALDSRPMPHEPALKPLFKLFATRAAAELRRCKIEGALRERENQVNRMIDSIMDAVLVLDDNDRIIRANPAARELFRKGGPLLGVPVQNLLTPLSFERFSACVDKLKSLPEGEKKLWLPQTLTALRGDESEFPAEATLSCFESNGHVLRTLIIRNIDERIGAEKRILQLTSETEFLRGALHDPPGSDQIIGRSPAMMEVFAAIERVSPTEATVLAQGETGTGKELVALAVHQKSRRAKEPLVRVNCAAVPGSLMESEFFGHEKGAFTGASTRRDGRFALANGGSIFLDEVGEMPLNLQAKLLRVLQEGEFQPVGGSQTVQSDVRVIAATNRDLEAMVRKGTFREDLYYRLLVFPIALPPLRERGDDIILLANAFIERYSRRICRPFEPLTDDDKSRLLTYSWPGNVRELQNVIERAMILSTGNRLNLASAMPASATEQCTFSAGDGSGALHVMNAREMEALERNNIVRALEQCEWRVSGDRGAAALLGLKPSTLSSRMKSLGISKP